ncbi:MAG TPA: peptidoglycan DD-metalloendopeptidase family protein [Xanthobacteraceae bacterium]|nr:peptidoglycan DD-metalloendopeptidase family protein [Xanthobacteraceae bacterium]
MDQARLRGARELHHRRLHAETIDLGNEPPLSVDGGAGTLVDRRRISVQWFSGTILTGLCGAALMGGAVFASLDGETNFASAPEQVESALRGAISSIGDRLSGARKTDRLPALSEPAVAHEVLRVPISSRTLNREVVRVRSYERVTGNLSLTVSDLSASIPPFNPQKLLADSVAGDNQTPAAEPDAEVSFITCDLTPPPKTAKAVAPAVCDLNSLLSKVKPSTLLPLDDIMNAVRDATASSAIGKSLLADASWTPSLKLGYAAEHDGDGYFGFAPRVVPENVTLLPKTSNQPNGGGDWSERQIVVKRGETVGSVLRELGAAPDEIKSIIGVIGPAALESGIKDGEKLRVLMAPAGLGHMQPLRVIIAGDSGITAAVALSDLGQYVPVDIRNIDTEATDTNEDDTGQPDAGGVSLYQSLWETGLRNNVPKAVVEDLIRIYSYDVDFERKVQPGDNFDVLYSNDENSEGASEVRYAALAIGGETKKYYRFQTPDDGAYDYYDEDGVSDKKFLVRKPVPTGIETSPFGWRTHPLLHISEMHTGVDWGAPYGTPIYAAGNGDIEDIGLKGGYGKYVRIRHANGYETAYGHMTAFARGLQVGSHVRQGQVIGFVGSSGLSTGSHVHFEIIVNGRFVDPMRVKLPRGRVLDGDSLASFEKDRSQLDAVLAAAPLSHVAQAH